MDFELHHADGQAESDDDLEGQPFRSLVPPSPRYCRSHPGFFFSDRFTRFQGKLADQKAGREEEVSDSELHLGLFAYPVLQAADILLYKCVTLSLMLLPSASLSLTDFR